MKMHVTMSFNYPEDEHKARLAINSEHMYETLQWIEERINESHLHDDNPDAVIHSIQDKVRLSLRLIGESDV
jgi:hypothetical protein